MKLALVLAAVPALAVLATACGDGSVPPRKEPQVRIAIGGPADGHTVDGDSVEIAGTVRPAGARVQVQGHDVDVEAGSFRATVALEPGVNLIDVAAGAHGRRPDFAVTRIVREVRLPIPDVVGKDADSATEQLDGLGLEVKSEDAGGFLDPLLPGDPKVCDMRPRAGAQVVPGSEVTLLVARDC